MPQRVQQFIQRRRIRSINCSYSWWQPTRSSFCALLMMGFLSLQWAMPLSSFALGMNPDNASFWSRPSYERKMNEVGNKILAANIIQTSILFRMSENATDLDAQAESKHHLILVGNALFPMMSSDDELAAVLSHEIAHIITGKSGHIAGGQISLLDILGTVIFVPDAILTTVSMGQTIKQRLGRATVQNRETAMDLIGIDLMVKAGYNPTAMESILREIATDSGNKHWRNRITITDRLTKIHAAIALKYPEYLPPQERTPATPEQTPAEVPSNTVKIPGDKGKTTAQGERNNPIQDAPQIETQVKAIPVDPQSKAQNIETPKTEPGTPTALKEAAPKAQPSATKMPSVQQLLEQQNDQPLPASPPGVPAALKPAN